MFCHAAERSMFLWIQTASRCYRSPDMSQVIASASWRERYCKKWRNPVKMNLCFILRSTAVASVTFTVATTLAGCSLETSPTVQPPAPPRTETPSKPAAPGKRVKVSYYGGAGSNHKLSRRTASGEPFDSSKLTAAHRSLPFGTRVRLNNPDTGKQVVVRVNDRGPFIKDRELDISHEAARQIGIIDSGVSHVEMSVESGENPIH